MSATPDYDFWRAERARLLDNNFPTPDTGRCFDAVDTILELEAELMALRDRITELEAERDRTGAPDA
jgi:hypothetical protein